MAFVLLLWILLLWTMRIIRVNQESRISEAAIGMGETFDWMGVEATPLEAHLYTLQEYNKIMGTDAVTDGNDDDILCLKINVVNRTGEAIGWDAFFDQFGYGFETVTWGSAGVPSLGAKLNLFASETLEDGASQEIWLATIVERDCFRESHWETISDMEFWYVMSVYPEPVRIRLEF